MDFNMSDEHDLFRKTVAEFVAKHITPLAKKIDEKGEFPDGLMKKLGEMGYLGLRYPPEFGGADGDNTMFCVFCEEMAKGSMSVAAVAAMQNLMGTHFVFNYGSEDHRKELLVPAIKGDKVGTIAMTEPGAGSDLASIQTTARRGSDKWILNGSKTWITNASKADFFTVLATTDKSKGMGGVNFFLVEKGTEGLSVGRTIEKMGLRGSATSEVGLDDCSIPEQNLLGTEGKGSSQLFEILGQIRTMTGALSIGLASVALQDAIEYSKERVQFGKPIGKFQAIKSKLAKVATELEAARLLVYYVSWMIDQKIPCMKESAMAKLFASEVAIRAVDEAFRVHASYGFSMDMPIQRYVRDARFLLIGGGTNEILEMIIAKELGV
jgi:alkylation response protein AidB-like acyl-CoA dehydrogenase